MTQVHLFKELLDIQNINSYGRNFDLYEIWILDQQQLSVWAASSLSPSGWTHRADG